MATWGSLTIQITDYGPPEAPINLVEIPLIPDPDADATTPQSVLMGTGRQRERVVVRGYFTSLADYRSMRDDYQNQIPRTLTAHDSETLHAYIARLSTRYRKSTASNPIIDFEAEFVESGE